MVRQADRPDQATRDRDSSRVARVTRYATFRTRQAAFPIIRESGPNGRRHLNSRRRAAVVPSAQKRQIRPDGGYTLMVHPYASEIYASAFAPLESICLPYGCTHVLRRPIPEAGADDALACYPLFVFEATEGLREDFDMLARLGLVSFVGVTDCLSQPAEAFLSRHFDFCRPYKQHLLHDARLPHADYTKHHRDRVRRARKSAETREVSLADHLDAWCAAYDTLVRRKNITGIQAFSRTYFERLALLPGIVTIAAFAGNELVSAHIWIRFEDKAYAHLAASTELGYKLRSAYAIYDHAIQLLRDDCVIDLGGGAGPAAAQSDGLSDFKRGFANTDRGNFLCGKILVPDTYRRLRGTSGAAFFPAYRSPS